MIARSGRLASFLLGGIKVDGVFPVCADCLLAGDLICLILSLVVPQVTARSESRVIPLWSDQPVCGAGMCVM